MKNLTAILCLTIAVLFGSVGVSFSKGQWFAIKNQPNCSVWNPAPQLEETITWSGDCLDGKAHGKGTLTYRYKEKSKWVEGVYEGEYANGKAHGQGTFTHPTGAKYVGGWKDDKQHGQGTLTFANGDKYVGQWKNGKYHGQGTETVEGKVKSGEWQDGKIVLYRPLPVKKGDLVKNFLCDNLDWFCPPSADANNLVVINGIYFRKFTDIPFTGKVTGKEQGLLRDGKKQGLWIGYYDNGYVMYRTHYKDGKNFGPSVSYNRFGNKDGVWISYHENGKVKARGTFKDGNKVGNWVAYTKDGTIDPTVTGTYKDGVKVSD